MEFACSQCGATPEDTLPETGKFECPYCNTPYLLVSDEDKVNTLPLWLGRGETEGVYFPFWRVYLESKGRATEHYVEETLLHVRAKEERYTFEREACFWIPATNTHGELGLEIDAVATSPSYNFYFFEDHFAETKEMVPKGKHRLINPSLTADQATEVAQVAVEREIKEDAFREHQDLRGWTTFKHQLAEHPALIYRAVRKEDDAIADEFSRKTLIKNETPPLKEK